MSILDTFRAGDAFDVVAETMFQDLVPRLVLVIPGAVAVAARGRRSWRDPMFLMFVGAITVYGWAALTDHPAWGRILAFAVPVANIALGDAVARLELGARLWTPRAVRPIPIADGVMALCGLHCPAHSPGSSTSSRLRWSLLAGLQTSFPPIAASSSFRAPSASTTSSPPTSRRRRSSRGLGQGHLARLAHPVHRQRQPRRRCARLDGPPDQRGPTSTGPRSLPRPLRPTGFDWGQPEPLQAALRSEGAAIVYQDNDFVLFDLRPPNRP